MGRPYIPVCVKCKRYCKTHESMRDNRNENRSLWYCPECRGRMYEDWWSQEYDEMSEYH